MGSTNDRNIIIELARKWQEGVITSEEKFYLEQWYDSFDDGTPELLPPNLTIGARVFDRIEYSIHPQKEFLKTKQTEL